TENSIASTLRPVGVVSYVTCMADLSKPVAASASMMSLPFAPGWLLSSVWLVWSKTSLLASAVPPGRNSGTASTTGAGSGSVVAGALADAEVDGAGGVGMGSPVAQPTSARSAVAAKAVAVTTRRCFTRRVYDPARCRL